MEIVKDEESFKDCTSFISRSQNYKSDHLTQKTHTDSIPKIFEEVVDICDDKNEFSEDQLYNDEENVLVANNYSQQESNKIQENIKSENRSPKNQKRPRDESDSHANKEKRKKPKLKVDSPIQESTSYNPFAPYRSLIFQKLDELLRVKTINK